ncbi:MAG: trehalose-phosphatase [Ilumatobacteraceae bacterium]
MTDAHLIRQVGRLAGAPRLLVGSDFDGTLSVLCDRPDHAVIEPRARQALESLAELPRTSVAVISGRTRAELVGLVGCHTGIQLIGAHGAERAGVPIGISDTGALRAWDTGHRRGDRGRPPRVLAGAQTHGRDTALPARS